VCRYTLCDVYPLNPTQLTDRPAPARGRRYNKRQMDFNALKDFNDYLEEVEDIIFNLCEGVDVKATEGKVEAYRREHAAEIARIHQRHADEERLRMAAGPSETWAPRRMSNDSTEDTPGPAAGPYNSSMFSSTAAPFTMLSVGSGKKRLELS